MSNLVQFEQLFDPIKKTFFKTHYVRRLQISVANTKIFTRQAIAKFFSPYTLQAQCSIWTMCRSKPNLFHVEHFLDRDEKDLF